MQKWWEQGTHKETLERLHKDKQRALTEAAARLDHLHEMELAAKEMEKEKKRAHERARWWSLRKHCMIQAKWEEWDKCLLYKENPKVAGFSPTRNLPPLPPASVPKSPPTRRQQLAALSGWA